MTWFLPHNFTKKHEILKRRAQIIKQIRTFFDDQSFTEVETPIRQVCPTFDTHIHGFKLEEIPERYLRTSPEFEMKKLLVAGAGDIYQIGANFRKGEHTKLHRPEFTMMEWYRIGRDYTALMNDCENLLKTISSTYTYKSRTCDAQNGIEKLSVNEAFKSYAKIELETVLGDTEKFKMATQSINIRTIESDEWDDVFHAIMSEKIEPYLGMDKPCILYDYPISMAALSKPKDSDPRYAERFELYVCGIELANAFSELTNPTEQRRRFHHDMAEKRRIHGTSYPADEEFFKALDHGLPECAGIALGIDRVIMLACGADDISEVVWCE